MLVTCVACKEPLFVRAAAMGSGETSLICKRCCCELAVTHDGAARLVRHADGSPPGTRARANTIPDVDTETTDPGARMPEPPSEPGEPTLAAEPPPQPPQAAPQLVAADAVGPIPVPSVPPPWPGTPTASEVDQDVAAPTSAGPDDVETEPLPVPSESTQIAVNPLTRRGSAEQMRKQGSAAAPATPAPASAPASQASTPAAPSAPPADPWWIPVGPMALQDETTDPQAPPAMAPRAPLNRQAPTGSPRLPTAAPADALWPPLSSPRARGRRDRLPSVTDLLAATMTGASPEPAPDPRFAAPVVASGEGAALPPGFALGPRPAPGSAQAELQGAAPAAEAPPDLAAPDAAVLPGAMSQPLCTEASAAGPPAGVAADDDRGTDPTYVAPTERPAASETPAHAPGATGAAEAHEAHNDAEIIHADDLAIPLGPEDGALMLATPTGNSTDTESFWAIGFSGAASQPPNAQPPAGAGLPAMPGAADTAPAFTPQAYGPPNADHAPPPLPGLDKSMGGTAESSTPGPRLATPGDHERDQDPSAAAGGASLWQVRDIAAPTQRVGAHESTEDDDRLARVLRRRHIISWAVLVATGATLGFVWSWLAADTTGDDDEDAGAEPAAPLVPELESASAQPPPSPTDQSPAARAKRHYRKANRLLGLERYQEAIVELEKCLKLDPQLSLAYRSLGIASMVLGQEKRAVQAYSRFVELSPKHKDARHIRRIIRQYHTRRKRR